MNRLYDFAIIGTGAAGSVLSYFLSQSGASVCLLEAGKNIPAGQYPTNELHANSQLFWQGGMELNHQANLLFLRGKVVGGGTVVNQCLLDRFDQIAIDNFKQHSGISWFNSQELNQHYSQIEQHLRLEVIPKQYWNGNAHLYAKGFENNQLKYAPLRRGQSQCHNHKSNDCIVCLGGCNRQSKQSMTVTFLPKALQQGVHLIDQVQVQQIIHGKPQTVIYGTKNNTPLQVRAKRVIVAAGAIGSTELLLKSGFGQSLPALGKGFFCHPQYMVFADMPEPVDAHKGAFQALKSADPRFRQQGFKLENVFGGPIATAMMKSGYGVSHHQFMQRYRHLACIEVAIQDENPGQIKLTRKGLLKIYKALSDLDQQKVNAGIEQVYNIFSSLRPNVIYKPHTPIGLHLMGGCTIGLNPNQAVVNESFQLFGYDNIHVVDSSIFPCAPGINPSLSVMALAHKASQAILDLAGYQTVTTHSKQPSWLEEAL
ncbi:GMC family oxidoreductase N-terminal domain-containing protein [Spartinivicinus poritis]|uniref:FAD-dependent oxidoreductase n=1 Tax=Spartinivicinus poritis TaxID=2994640 RepID=A0ABT5UAL3_9GAMM|nr:GMC family oxidoreductase N-terminal domain-containing protein [Spartinivicinus sp. A2-2]MDE1463021.1 FAD-dependent oxidoreductase [Spartinivicinus sp. A2-2]